MAIDEKYGYEAGELVACILKDSGKIFLGVYKENMTKIQELIFTKNFYDFPNENLEVKSIPEVLMEMDIRENGDLDHPMTLDYFGSIFVTKEAYRYVLYTACDILEKSKEKILDIEMDL